MAGKVKPVPDGYHTLTPFLCVRGGADAIEFYRKAFGAEEISRMDAPGGKVAHAEIKIGDSRLMLADEMPDMPDDELVSPAGLGGTAVNLHLYLPDVDARFKRAVDAGAIVRREVKDQFYGDRNGILEDPFGHIWTVSTHIEDLDAEQIKERMAAMAGAKP